MFILVVCLVWVLLLAMCEFVVTKGVGKLANILLGAQYVLLVGIIGAMIFVKEFYSPLFLFILLCVSLGNVGIVATKTFFAFEEPNNPLAEIKEMIDKIVSPVVIRAYPLLLLVTLTNAIMSLYL